MMILMTNRRDIWVHTSLINPFLWIANRNIWIWVEMPSFDKESSDVCVRVEIIDKNNSDLMVSQVTLDPKPAYCIQRGKIRAVDLTKPITLSAAVQFESMGSAEFEWGAIPAAFRAIKAQSPLFELHEVSDELLLAYDVSGKAHPLYMYANFESLDQKKAFRI